MTSTPLPPLPDHFHFRPLEVTDYACYIEMLSQLTTVGDMDETKYREIFEEFTANKHIYDIWVVEDDRTKRLAAATTLFIEKKLIHGGSCVGHIEDVVTHKDYRHSGIGRALVCI